MSRYALIALLAGGMLSGVATGEPVGQLTGVAGTVALVRQDGDRRLAAEGTAVGKGDRVQTESGSSARIRFSDGSEMAIRERSAVVVQDYHYQAEKPEKDSFVIGLLRGGLRQISGWIGKRGNQDAYRLQSGTATIGIRGTDFSARLCEGGDCRAEGGQPAAKAPVTPVAARIVQAAGKVMVQRDSAQLPAASGDALYKGDVVLTEPGGHAALVFSDQTRVVLPADSSFRISGYSYSASQPASGSMFLEMIKGGLRVVSGLIGKVAPRKVSVGTPTATIGIRGTNFDLACVPAGISSPEGYAGGSGGCGGGLYAVTREGEIEVTGTDGTAGSVKAGETGFVGAPGQGMLLIRFSPEFMRQFNGPLPEKISFDIPDLFGIDGSGMSDVGLYVTVADGKVVIAQAGRELLLGKGEGGFASLDGAILQRLTSLPPLVGTDTLPMTNPDSFKGCRL